MWQSAHSHRSEVQLTHGRQTQSPEDRPSYEWWILGLWIVCAYLLGAYGFWKYNVDHGLAGEWLDDLYHAVQLFALHAPALEPPLNPFIELGRWMAVVVVFLAVWKTFKRVFPAEVRALALNLYNDHVVICGDGQLVFDVLRHVRKTAPSRRVVVIAELEDHHLIEAGRKIGAVVLVGSPTHFLERAGLVRAERIIAAYQRDVANVEVVVTACALLKTAPARATRVKCFAQVADLDLRDSLRRNHLLGDHPPCEVHFFDVFDDAAREVLLKHLPIDHDGIAKDDPRQVHLIIVGFGALGFTVAIRAAQLGHFANGKKLRISVIDRDAEAREDALYFRHPSIGEQCDITFWPHHAESTATHSLIQTWCRDPGSVTSVVVCIDDDVLAMKLAMRLLPEVQETGARFAVRMSHPHGLTSLINRPEAVGPHHVIKAFGWSDEQTLARLLGDDPREQKAAMVHGGFLQLAKSAGRTKAYDDAMHKWKRLDNEDYRESSLQQVDHLPIKLRAVGLEAVTERDASRSAVMWDARTIDFDVLAQMEHRRWVTERALSGWTYGPGKKDAEARKNPNMVPWAQLTDEVKAYDYQAVFLIPALLSEVEKLKICFQSPGVRARDARLQADIVGVKQP